MTNPELTVLSFGGGQDSTTLLYKYVNDPIFRATYAPNRFLVVMADTGDEHPETVKHVEWVKSYCLEHNIEFAHITPELGFHSEKWQSLRGFYNLSKTVGSKAFPKTCTDRLKIRPIYKFLENWLSKEYGVSCNRKKGLKEFAAEHGKINMIIGIAKGEESRMTDASTAPEAWKRLAINMVYPLVDLGLDRAACQEYMGSLDLPVPPPSNCILCPFMSDIELLWLHRFMNEDLQDWIRIEAAKLAANTHMGDRNLGVWGVKNLSVKLAEVIAKHDHMTDEDLNEYKFSHGHCVKSKY